MSRNRKPKKDAETEDDKPSPTDSTRSDASNYEPFEKRPSRASRASIVAFSDQRKSRQSFGAYTSLFARKLLPPLGFYRESDKYAQLKIKFKDDDLKLEALDEMWDDYKKYQIRKRFRWPPQLIGKKFFWTTGYYADYQKIHRATKLRKPGEDSSEEEFIDPAGQFRIAGGDDDIDLDEFERYREAKKQGLQGLPPSIPRYSIRFRSGEEPDDNYLVNRRPTLNRIFDEGGDRERRKSLGPSKEVEEVETIVEYALIRDPNKKKRKSRRKSELKKNKEKAEAIEDENEKPPSILEGIELDDLEPGKTKKIVKRRKSVAQVDSITGERTVSVEEDSEVVDGGSEMTGNTGKKTKKKKPKPQKDGSERSERGSSRR